MTESLFFSQIATKSINAKNIANSASAKAFRNNSSDFDRHLSLSDRDSSRGRDKDNITELRKEPRFTKETQDRDYSSSERREPSVAKNKTQEARPERPERTRTREETSHKGHDNTNNGSTAENTKSEDTTLTKAAPEDQQGVVEPHIDSEEISLESLVNILDETPPQSQEAEINTQEQLVASNETNDAGTVTPLFSPTPENAPLVTQSETAQPHPAIQASNSQTAAKEQQETHQPDLKAPTQNAMQKLEGQIESKQASETNKPGLVNALNNVRAGKPETSAKIEVSEVQNVSKNASFLGDVNIEVAQKTGKTDIKARIGELSQNATNTPVATSVQTKSLFSTPQLIAGKADITGQIQTVSAETALPNTPNLHSVQVRFGSLPQTTQTAQIPVTTMAFHIAKSAENGVNRFEIRIDPPELGRVDVKLEVNQAGRVIANLTVDRPETLDLLQRDQRALERALQDAGLDVGGDSLNFSLKDQSANSSDDTSLDAEKISENSEAEEQLIEPEIITGYVTNTGVDIRI